MATESRNVCKSTSQSTARKARTVAPTSGVVGDVARGKDQTGILAVQISNLVLERQVQRAVSGNVPRPAGTCAVLVECLVHCVEDDWVPAHAEIVIRAPDGDLFLRTSVCHWELFSEAVDVVEVSGGGKERGGMSAIWPLLNCVRISAMHLYDLSLCFLSSSSA